MGDPEIAADFDAARAAGTLASSPEDAWGNASIPGFGIGEPVRAPHLDPEALPELVVDHETAERFTHRQNRPAEKPPVLTSKPVLVHVSLWFDAFAQD